MDATHTPTMTVILLIRIKTVLQNFGFVLVKHYQMFNRNRSNSDSNYRPGRVRMYQKGCVPELTKRADYFNFCYNETQRLFDSFTKEKLRRRAGVMDHCNICNKDYCNSEPLNPGYGYHLRCHACIIEPPFRADKKYVLTKEHYIHADLYLKDLGVQAL